MDLNGDAASPPRGHFVLALNTPHTTRNKLIDDDDVAPMA